MKKTFVIAAAGVVAAASTTLAGGPAQARSGNHVTINVIASRTTPSAASNSLAKVLPSVSYSGHLRITHKVITVVQDGKVVANRVTFASLPGGSYQVTTYVTYKTYKVSHGDWILKGKYHKKKSQTLVINRRCATQVEFNSVGITQGDEGGSQTLSAPTGDPISTVAAMLHSNGAHVPLYDGGPAAARTAQAAEDEPTYEGRIYPQCDSDTPFFVVFQDGIAVYKDYYTYWD